MAKGRRSLVSGGPNNGSIDSRGPLQRVSFGERRSSDSGSLEDECGSSFSGSSSSLVRERQPMDEDEFLLGVEISDLVWNSLCGCVSNSHVAEILAECLFDVKKSRVRHQEKWVEEDSFALEDNSDMILLWRMNRASVPIVPPSSGCLSAAVCGVSSILNVKINELMDKQEQEDDGGETPPPPGWNNELFRYSMTQAILELYATLWLVAAADAPLRTHELVYGTTAAEKTVPSSSLASRRSVSFHNGGVASTRPPNMSRSTEVKTELILPGSLRDAMFQWALQFMLSFDASVILEDCLDQIAVTERNVTLSQCLDVGDRHTGPSNEELQDTRQALSLETTRLFLFGYWSNCLTILSHCYSKSDEAVNLFKSLLGSVFPTSIYDYSDPSASSHPMRHQNLIAVFRMRLRRHVTSSLELSNSHLLRPLFSILTGACCPPATHTGADELKYRTATPQAVPPTFSASEAPSIEERDVAAATLFEACYYSSWPPSWVDAFFAHLYWHDFSVSSLPQSLVQELHGACPSNLIGALFQHWWKGHSFHTLLLPVSDVAVSLLLGNDVDGLLVLLRENPSICTKWFPTLLASIAYFDFDIPSDDLLRYCLEFVCQEMRRSSVTGGNSVTSKLEVPLSFRKLVRPYLLIMTAFGRCCPLESTTGVPNALESSLFVSPNTPITIASETECYVVSCACNGLVRSAPNSVELQYEVFRHSFLSLAESQSPSDWASAFLLGIHMMKSGKAQLKIAQEQLSSSSSTSLKVDNVVPEWVVESFLMPSNWIRSLICSHRVDDLIDCLEAGGPSVSSTLIGLVPTSVFPLLSIWVILRVASRKHLEVLSQKGVSQPRSDPNPELSKFTFLWSWRILEELTKSLFEDLNFSDPLWAAVCILLEFGTFELHDTEWTSFESFAKKQLLHSLSKPFGQQTSSTTTLMDADSQFPNIHLPISLRLLVTRRRFSSEGRTGGVQSVDTANSGKLTLPTQWNEGSVIVC